jgi:hypothetical protein
LPQRPSGMTWRSRDRFSEDSAQPCRHFPRNRTQSRCLQRRSARSQATCAPVCVDRKNRECSPSRAQRTLPLCPGAAYHAWYVVVRERSFRRRRIRQHMRRCLRQRSAAVHFRTHSGSYRRPHSSQVPSLRLIFDHCGLISNSMRAALGRDKTPHTGEQQQKAFEEVLRLADHPNVALKRAHAPAMFRLRGFPGTDLWPILRRPSTHSEANASCGQAM